MKIKYLLACFLFINILFASDLPKENNSQISIITEDSIELLRQKIESDKALIEDIKEKIADLSLVDNSFKKGIEKLFEKRDKRQEAANDLEILTRKQIKREIGLEQYDQIQHKDLEEILYMVGMIDVETQKTLDTLKLWYANKKGLESEINKLELERNPFVDEMWKLQKDIEEISKRIFENQSELQTKLYQQEHPAITLTEMHIEILENELRQSKFQDLWNQMFSKGNPAFINENGKKRKVRFFGEDLVPQALNILLEMSSYAKKGPDIFKFWMENRTALIEQVEATTRVYLEKYNTENDYKHLATVKTRAYWVFRIFFEAGFKAQREAEKAKNIKDKYKLPDEEIGFAIHGYLESFGFSDQAIRKILDEDSKNHTNFKDMVIGKKDTKTFKFDHFKVGEKYSIAMVLSTHPSLPKGYSHTGVLIGNYVFEWYEEKNKENGEVESKISITKYDINRIKALIAPNFANTFEMTEELKQKITDFIKGTIDLKTFDKIGYNGYNFSKDFLDKFGEYGKRSWTRKGIRPIRSIFDVNEYIVQFSLPIYETEKTMVINNYKDLVDCWKLNWKYIERDLNIDPIIAIEIYALYKSLQDLFFKRDGKEENENLRIDFSAFEYENGTLKLGTGLSYAFRLNL